MKISFRTRLRLWVNENGWLALISAAVAVGIFFTVREIVSYTETLTIAVEVERDAGFALMAVRPASVRVTFRGALSDLRQLDRRDPRMIVRAPRDGSSGGHARIRLRPRNLRGAAGIRVVSIEPSFVDITFDHQGEREFAIAPPALEGRPLRGHAEVEYTPRTAVVRGARLQLDHLHDLGVTLQVEPVNVDGRVQGFSKRVAILPPADAWMPEIVPAEVNVKIVIAQESSVREFSGVPVRLESDGEPAHETYAAEPAAVTVRLAGWAETLRDIPTNALRVYAACPAPAAPAASNAVPLRVFLSPGLQVENVATIPPAVRLVRLPPKD
jgi:hypothetical protein